MIRSVVALALLWSTGIGITGAAELAPPEITTTLTAIDKASSDRNLEGVMQYFTTNFRNSDGMKIEQLRSGLSTLWARYGEMEYQTKIDQWERKDNEYILQTTTMIKGLKPKDSSDFLLEAQLTSEQTYRLNGTRWQMLGQRILQERSTLRSGEEPPKVQLQLPQEIGVGRNYTLDAIITQPLGNSFVLGAAIDEEVSPSNYLKERAVDLAPLRAGGIFKIGTAPFAEGNRWISVVLVQESGITIASQRLKVSKNFKGNQYTPLPDLDIRRRLQPKAPSTL